MGYSVEDIKPVLTLFCDKAIISKPLLTELDSRSGDGDLGISMAKAAAALKEEVARYGGRDVGAFFARCGMTVNRAAPSTMGTLLSNAMLYTGNTFKGSEALEPADVIRIPSLMRDAIMLQGNAALGDKTILDALIPLSEALEHVYRETGDFTMAITAAVEAAKKGAKSTRGMTARVGRAKWIAERSQDSPDAGAVLCYLLMDSLLEVRRPKGYRLISDVF